MKVDRSLIGSGRQRGRDNLAVGALYNRSRVTNGRDLLPDIDGRGVWARRYRDLIGLHVSDLGGLRNISQAQLSLVRRAAALTVELERLEARFAQDDDATSVDLEKHQRATNTLRRVLSVLGLERKARLVNGANEATAEIVEAIRERAANA